MPVPAPPDVRARIAGALDLRDLTILVTAFCLQLFAIGTYFAATPAVATAPVRLLYPPLWIAVAVWAVLTVDRPEADRRGRLLGAAVGAGYVLLVTWIAGLFGPTAARQRQLEYVSGGLEVAAASPGWGPQLTYVGDAAFVVVVPYLAIGYLAIGYLLYVAVADATAAALSGVFGVFACVGCSFSLVTSLLAGTAGASSAAGTAILSLSLELSTLAFLLAVGFLYWRPGFGD